MAWWDELTEYLRESGLYYESVDILYFCLWGFTHFYLLAVALLYLSGASDFDTNITKVIRALAEPYLGAVGIYTILKESRKRRYGIASRHKGEIFVILWMLLFILSAMLALATDIYSFNRTLELITMLSFSIGVIYIGGVVHKP